MSELAEYRMHQQIAQEIYRQQILQRLPDPYPTMLPVPPPRHMHLPPLYTLTGIDAKLQNMELWSQFHQIGTEMIITKSGRRMFPSMRVTLSGLEDDTSYCVMLEMVPVGDCRYKFSGSQWVPAGGAEPQSPQRMFLHPDSPALGSHWMAQPILFNKVKLTNNTLDSNGHIVLTSMHKYRPRIYVIRTSEPSQIPWAPQQAFSFPETEFVAVTAYQNDRITKLKIDNNPFAKGFRETGQSRCKRKTVASTEIPNESKQSSPALSLTSNGKSSMQSLSPTDTSSNTYREISVKRARSDSSICSISSLDDSGLSVCGSLSRTSSPAINSDENPPIMRQFDQQESHLDDHNRSSSIYHNPNEIILQQYNQNIYNFNKAAWMDFAMYISRAGFPFHTPSHEMDILSGVYLSCSTPTPIMESHFGKNLLNEVSSRKMTKTPNAGIESVNNFSIKPTRNNFTIDAILGHTTR